MKTIEVSDDVHAALQRLGARFHQSPSALLELLLYSPAGIRVAGDDTDSIAAFVIDRRFAHLATEDERYLALLSWVATRHAAEFCEFIRSQPGQARHLTLSAEDVLAICRRNHARQIAGTQFWAIMNIATDTKRRFVARLLDFVGYRREAIQFVDEALAPASARGLRSAA